MLKLKRKIGDTVIELQEEEKDLKEALARTLFFTEKNVCQCGSEDVDWVVNRADDYTYIKRVCQKCQYQSVLGSFKKGGYYWRDWEKYAPKENN